MIRSNAFPWLLVAIGIVGDAYALIDLTMPAFLISSAIAFIGLYALFWD